MDFAKLFELESDPQIVMDDRGRIRAANAAARRLSGLTAAELFGLTLSDIVSPTDRAAVRAAFKGSRESGTSHSGSITLQTRKRGGLTADLRMAWIPPDSCIATFYEGGLHKAEIARLQRIADIQQLGAIREQLNEARQRLQFHVQCTPLAHVVWDSKYRIVEWNPAAEQLFGYTKSEALAMQAVVLFPPQTRHMVREALSRLVASGASSHSVHDNIRKDGSRLTCEWFRSALRDSSGRVHGVVAMARDAAGHEALESRMRDLQKLEGLGVLASGVAHDFNSSLTIVLGHAALLRAAGNLTPKTAEHVEAIEEAGLRSSQLVKHLLAYARTGRHNPQPTSLNDLIRDCLKFLRTSLGRKHDIRTELADKLPTIVADRGQIEQIVLNLCLNAKQAMPDGGETVIATRVVCLSASEAAQCVPHDACRGEYVELSVKDSGCGMDAATITRIFDPFFTTKADGHGLGLAAVLGILRQHRGAARVQSSPGRGTTVRICLPV